MTAIVEVSGNRLVCIVVFDRGTVLTKPSPQTPSSFSDVKHAHLLHVDVHKRCMCTSSHLIYCISCSRCGMLYIGETGRCLRTRFGKHHRSVTSNGASQPVARHFNNDSHCVSDMKIRALCPISGSNDSQIFCPVSHCLVLYYAIRFTFICLHFVLMKLIDFCLAFILSRDVFVLTRIKTCVDFPDSQLPMKGLHSKRRFFLYCFR